MTYDMPSLKQVKQSAKHAVREATPWIECLARFGYTTKGILYITIGLLAARAAFGSGDTNTDSDDAFRTIIQQPFGSLLLAIITIGLIGYMLWRFIQLLFDPDRKGSDLKGLVLRAGYLVSGVIYGSLAVSAFRLIFMHNSSNNDSQPRHWAARILQQPLGRWLLCAVGAIILGYGLYQIYKAYTAKFRRKLKNNEMSTVENRWSTRISKFGIGARGIVFVISGGLVLQAALETDPAKTEGMGGTLQLLSSLNYGAWVLFVIAGGLVAYGIYNLVQARYRYIYSV